MSEVKLVNKLPSTVSLTTEEARYRDSMAGFLQDALAIMDDILSPVGLNDNLEAISTTEVEKDPFAVFRGTSRLLTKKARFHVIAVLCANKNSNIHSLAVQMRPALECAGQVVSIVRNLFGKHQGAESALGQYLDADYYQTVKRLSKGQVDYNSLLAEISGANPMRTEPLRTVKSLKESDTVKDLEFGRHWYAHLSKYFYHSNLPALKGISFSGGVGSNNTIDDHYAFAALLDYLAHQVMVMVMYAALCLDATSGTGDRFEKAGALLSKKRETSDRYRDTLMSMAQQSDGTL